MAQITIYMDDEMADKMRAAAKAAGLSMSAWLTRLVRQRVQTEWPTDVAALAGSWGDMPSAEEQREGFGTDVPREPM